MKVVNKQFPQSLESEFSTIFSKWPFPLSDFQKWAIYSIHNGHDTMVCAPTGSGKTLPAEFAIDYFTSKGKKVIYTTPIKALSNDKLSELTQKFPHITFGLLTGDNKFNPEAQVLIMTTEIYLNTLLKLLFMKSKEDYDPKKLCLDFNMNIDEELGFVIHDEIHYINDRDRGHVWEKAIMNQPKHIPYIGLSATIASPQKLCKWSENPDKANRGEIYLCESHIRNVPIEHFGFVTIPDSNYRKMSDKDTNAIEDMCDKLISIKYQDKPFNEPNYNKIKKTLKYIYDHKIKVKDQFVFNKVIEYLRMNNLLPALVFVFSRKQCHTWAKMVQASLFEEDSKLPSIIEKEAKKILIAKLSNWKEYVSLPEFGEIIKLLEKGVAVHHSGVTPVFREMIEILYRKGYIKLLVATETFAIGVNVAIKSVIYTGLQKFDGKGFRYLYSHEYAQGSGRAGRRGKDTKGVVIHLMNVYDRRDSVPDAGECRLILSGKPENLKSKFCIDFKLIISMLASNNKNFTKYVNTSMLSDEITNSLGEFYNKNIELNIDLDKIKNGFQYLRNSIEILEEYHDDNIKVNLTSKKQRKQLQRKILNTVQNNKGLELDYKKYTEHISLKKEIDKNNKIIENTENYVSNEISLHIKILEQENFIEEGPVASIKGMMANNLHEIHSLAVTDVMYSGEFDNLTVEELVSVLSVFTHIKISDDQSYVDVNNTNVNDTIKSTVKKIKKSLNKYYDIETKYQTNFTDSYDIHYDMCGFMYKWCFAENEVDCKLIYNEAKKYNIYMGEFVKAILKIVNVCSELEKAAAVQENIKLIHTLSLVRDKVLKSVATNQSLYV
jgi:superfamily II RNA helicase